MWQLATSSTCKSTCIWQGHEGFLEQNGYMYGFILKVSIILFGYMSSSLSLSSLSFSTCTVLFKNFRKLYRIFRAHYASRKSPTLLYTCTGRSQRSTTHQTTKCIILKTICSTRSPTCKTTNRMHVCLFDHQLCIFLQILEYFVIK